MNNQLEKWGFAGVLDKIGKIFYYNGSAVKMH
jgi:hypothetical protein